jgi:hypothetical protein
MKRILLIGGAIALVVVLAGAAFVAGRLLNGQPLAMGGEGGQNIVLNTGGPGGGAVSVKLNIEPARELPQTQPDTRGLFDHRADSSIFIGTGQVQMMVQKKPDGTLDMSAKHDGPVVEVVVTHDTVVYSDVTMKDAGALPPGQQSGEVKKQQVLEPGSIDQIAEYSQVTVWGEKRGDRIIAQTLVYTPPPVLVGSPGGPAK